MHRIDNARAAIQLPPTQAPGPNPGGYFQAETIFTHAWLNAAQEESCYIIENTGFTLNKNSQDQLYNSIVEMAARGPTDSGISSVMEDRNPHLGGNLVVNNKAITSDSNGNVVFIPFGALDFQCDTVLVHTSLMHLGDPENIISFGTDAQNFIINNQSIFDINNTGVRLGGANARVATILDEDDMASNSDAALCTQQSFKKFADDRKELVYSQVLNSPLYVNSSSGPDKVGFGDIILDYGFDYKNGIQITRDGVLKKLYIRLQQQSGSPTAVALRVEVYKNHAPTGVFVTYSGTAAYLSFITISDLVHSVNFVIGDLLQLRVTISSGTSEFSGSASMEYF